MKNKKYYYFEINPARAEQLHLSKEKIDKCNKRLKGKSLDDLKKNYRVEPLLVDPLLLILKGQKGENAYVRNDVVMRDYQKGLDRRQISNYVFVIDFPSWACLTAKELKQWSDIAYKFFKIFKRRHFYKVEFKDYQKGFREIKDGSSYKSYKEFGREIARFVKYPAITEQKPIKNISERRKQDESEEKKYIAFIYRKPSAGSKSYREISRLLGCDKDTVKNYEKEVLAWSKNKREEVSIRCRTSRRWSNIDFYEGEAIEEEVTIKKKGKDKKCLRISRPKHSVPIEDAEYNITDDGIYTQHKTLTHKSSEESEED